MRLLVVVLVIMLAGCGAAVRIGGKPPPDGTCQIINTDAEGSGIGAIFGGSVDTCSTTILGCKNMPEMIIQREGDCPVTIDTRKVKPEVASDG
jgi:hypothetical protein